MRKINAHIAECRVNDPCAHPTESIYILFKLIIGLSRAGGITNFDTGIQYLFTTGIYGTTGYTVFSVITEIPSPSNYRKFHTSEYNRISVSL